MVSSMGAASDGNDKKAKMDNGEKPPVHRFPPLHPAALVPHFPSNPQSTSIHQLDARSGSIQRNPNLSIPNPIKHGLSIPSTPRPGLSVPSSARTPLGSQISMTEVVAAAKRAKAANAAAAFAGAGRPPQKRPAPPPTQSSSPDMADGPAIPSANPARFGMFRRIASAMQFTARMRQDAEVTASQMMFRNSLAATGQHPSARSRSHHDHPPETAKDPMQLFCLRFKPEWVVDPAGNRYYYWMGFLSLAVIYNWLMVVPRSVFRELDEGDFVPVFLVLDYVSDVIYIIDIFVQMFKGYLDEGIIVTEPRRLIRAYIRTTSSKLDILSIMPTDFILIGTGLEAPYPFVRINRLLKWGRFREFFAALESRTNHPDFLRTLDMMLTFSGMIHLNACLFYFISDEIGLNTDGWVYPSDARWRSNNDSDPTDNSTNVNDTLYTKYVLCAYWSLQTLTLIGQNKQPEYEFEFAFVTVNFLVGVIVYANIVGNITRTVANMSILMDSFRHRMDAVKQYMTLRKIDGDLQERVMRYFEYQWTNKQFNDETKSLACLPDKLEAELAMRVHLETLQRVGIFQDAEPGLLADLVLKLKLEVYSPQDYICRKGDIGKEMYIVKRGRLEVVADDGNTVYATLSEGSVFGEISILNIIGIKTGNRRTANVRSVGYSDLFCLSKEALWDALKEYPEGKKKMLEKGKQMLVKDNLLDREMNENYEHRQLAFMDKVERLESNLDDLQTRFGRLVAEEASSLKKMRLRTAQLHRLINTRYHGQSKHI
ncbi:cyclic nucleotide-gated cation channel alpha-3-like [Paramacrobiotus metropolitanus]|uniref:cyclic nucleotide-gated cation channel alpha-3-like n=1 Tax=Paramacrobiotus metropolitanus TaxID=2943436 RepID=UPI002445A5EC|nr:cyclic nucleotide-gated cation channel alpha-3-like [Paramacrobiotus metropolitanus]